jgi:hypothetical protein
MEVFGEEQEFMWKVSEMHISTRLSDIQCITCIIRAYKMLTLPDLFAKFLRDDVHFNKFLLQAHTMDSYLENMGFFFLFFPVSLE